MYQNSRQIARAQVTKQSAERILDVLYMTENRPGMEKAQFAISLCIEARENELAEANRTLSR